MPDAVAFARAVFERLADGEDVTPDDLVDLLLYHGLGRVVSLQGTYGIDVVLAWSGPEESEP